MHICFFFLQSYLQSSLNSTANLYSVINIWRIFSGVSVGWGTVLQGGRSRVQFPMRSLGFLIDLMLAAAPCPWGQLSLWHKWEPWISPGVKASQCVGLTPLPLSYANYLEILLASASWNPKSTVQACNWIAFPLLMYEVYWMIFCLCSFFHIDIWM
jgi:hypothetical protein